MSEIDKVGGDLELLKENISEFNEKFKGLGFSYN